jgi:hypothetical protein
MQRTIPLAAALAVAALILVGITTVYPAANVKFSDADTLQAKFDKGCTEVEFVGWNNLGANTNATLLDTWYPATYQSVNIEEDPTTDPLAEWSYSGQAIAEWQYDASDDAAAEVLMRCTMNVVAQTTTNRWALQLAKGATSPITDATNDLDDGTWKQPRMWQYMLFNLYYVATIEGRFTVADGEYVAFGFKSDTAARNIKTFNFVCTIREIGCFTDEN